MAQRNLSVGDVMLVLRFGRKEHWTGVKFFFMAERDVPPGQERELERLVGTTVVAADECILTVYRNERALARMEKAVRAVIETHEDNVRYYRLCRSCAQGAEVFGGKPLTERKEVYVV
jgi:hypothetical protein